MTTDAEYRALAERLGESADGWDECGPSYADNSALERAASSAILALLDERDEAVRRYDGAYSQWGLAAKLCDEHRARATLAESRLGKAMEALRAWLKADDIGIGVGIKNAREAARSVLSDLEKSE